MTHIFINALAASAGGGLTYIRNVVPLFAGRSGARATLLADAALAREFQGMRNVDCIEWNNSGGAARRFWSEQKNLPRLLRASGADVLLSAGNFALRQSPVPQILLSRNSLYTSAAFRKDLRARGELRLWLENAIKSAAAKWSVRTADRVVAPSQAFAAELRRWTGSPVVAIHHGFDRDAFMRDPAPLPEAMQRQLDARHGEWKLLFVSHYNYYRNFETLLRALPLLQQKLLPRHVCLLLTTSFQPGANPGSYRTDRAAALVEQLGIAGSVVQLGAVPYHSLHQLYRQADVYVTPAYTETFAHPLVEAMSCGLPVVASDLPVHREICGEAGVYFPPFSPDELAQRVVELANSKEQLARIRSAGDERVAMFSWRKHLDQILALAEDLLQKRSASLS